MVCFARDERSTQDIIVMAINTRFALIILALLVAVYPLPMDLTMAQMTSFDDHQNMMDQLGIKTLRPGANPNDPSNADESKANIYADSLPDVLKMEDGTRVTSAAQWPARRAEIQEDFEREIYGRIPANVPMVKWSVTESKETTTGGIATITRTLVGEVDNSAYPQVSVRIQASLTVPANASASMPVMVEFGRLRTDTTGPATAASAGPVSQPSEPAWHGLAIRKGWAYAILSPASIQPDSNHFTTGIIGLTNHGQPRTPEQWGALRAWQWGVSRLIDCFETHPEFGADASKVGIAGLSRFGKAALVTEAFEPRIAVGLIGSSGEGGAKLHRHILGEAVENLTGGGYYWMAGNFMKYGASDPLRTAADLPIDSHELIALCAPRPCFISYGVPEKGDPVWVDARGSFMAAVLAGPVYELLGAKGLGTPGNYLTDPMPPPLTLIGGQLAWRQHEGGHDLTPNWPAFFDWVERFVPSPVQHARAGIVEFAPSPDAFAIASAGKVATIYVDGEDYPGVLRAAGDFADDIRKVTGTAAKLNYSTDTFAARPILIGTLGKSAIINRLVADHKLDVSPITGNWESSITQVIANPMPGVESALVIAGSDKRGTIYGIYELSRQMGVSPWYWWADVPPQQHDAVFVKAGTFIQGPPAVKYRGIFLNDEAPAMSGWAKEKFGGFNHKMYTHVFELLLRLKANYLWPAMWGSAFNEDDPENPKLADDYGIVMGTSHQEPMMRAQAEWDHRHKGKDWNFATDPDELEQFWRDGIQRNKNYDNLITIGLRGRDDTEMIKNATIEQSTQLLEKIVTLQRKIIADEVNPDVTKVPQMWCLYKEVQSYYERGLRVPDDVTLLWSDDNWGNLRRVPTAEERHRGGGAGIYYHFDYVGDPRSYKWINTNPLPKIWEQMNIAYRYGADRIWIVNVGDLKPMELPIDFFMRLAWDPGKIGHDQIGEYTRQWAAEQFGPEHADEIADILGKYAKYNGWRKPELLEPTTFSLINYHEADRVEQAWQDITERAEKIYATLPPQSRDAFYQLVLYPAKASATVAELYIAAGRNHLYASQRRASTNDQAKRVRELFKLDQDLSDYYNHTLAGGKWDHMMDQTRIGYTSWSDPKTNVMPTVQEIQVPAVASLGIAVEGSELSWPGDPGEPKLPVFDSVNQQRYAIDVFNRGGEPFDFTAEADQPWVTLSKTTGRVERDERLWVNINWTAAPVGDTSAVITVARDGGESVSIKVESLRSTEVKRETLDAFGGLKGPTAIAAEAATANVPAGGVRWEKIPDFGRGASGMSIFPVTAASVTPPQASPCLEYLVYLPQPGQVQVDTVIGPTLDFVPGRGLRFAVSIDDERPQVLDVFAEQYHSHAQWQQAVKDGVRTRSSTHTITAAGVHVLKLWMVDPGVVLEKLIVHQGDIPPSYFGPPEALTTWVNPTTVPATSHGSAAVPTPRNDANSKVAHEQLVAKAKAGGIDLYFLGDSITRRWGCTDPQWAANLANWKQNFFGWNAADFGWGADSIQNMLWRIQNGELDGVNPKVIVILAGTNNIGKRPGGDQKITDIVNGLDALIDTCRQKAPDAKIILTAIFPRNDSLEVWPEIQRVNELLAQRADGKRIFYVNVNDKLADADGKLFDGMTVDKIHLTPKGYQVWADGLRPLLVELLGPPAQSDHAPPATGDPSMAHPATGS
jgi:lysophospholipase L1-like esterase